MRQQFLHYDSRNRRLVLRDVPTPFDRTGLADIASGILTIVALALCFIYLAIIAGFLQPDFVR